MRIFNWMGRVTHRVVVIGTIRTVALVSRLIDALIGLVGRMSDRLDSKLAELARDSNERHRRDGRRQIDPVTLD